MFFILNIKNPHMLPSLLAISEGLCQEQLKKAINHTLQKCFHFPLVEGAITTE